MKSKSTILTPKQVLDMYYLDARLHILEIAAMLDRGDRGKAAYGENVDEDLRAKILSQALEILASPSEEPNRVERLLNLFSTLDTRHPQEGE